MTKSPERSNPSMSYSKTEDQDAKKDKEIMMLNLRIKELSILVNQMLLEYQRRDGQTGNFSQSPKLAATRVGSSPRGRSSEMSQDFNKLQSTAGISASGATMNVTGFSYLGETNLDGDPDEGTGANGTTLDELENLKDALNTEKPSVMDEGNSCTLKEENFGSLINESKVLDSERTLGEKLLGSSQRHLQSKTHHARTHKSMNLSSTIKASAHTRKPTKKEKDNLVLSKKKPQKPNGEKRPMSTTKPRINQFDTKFGDEVDSSTNDIKALFSQTFATTELGLANSTNSKRTKKSLDATNYNPKKSARTFANTSTTTLPNHTTTTTSAKKTVKSVLKSTIKSCRIDLVTETAANRKLIGTSRETPTGRRMLDINGDMDRFKGINPLCSPKGSGRVGGSLATLSGSSSGGGFRAAGGGSGLGRKKYSGELTKSSNLYKGTSSATTGHRHGLAGRGNHKKSNRFKPHAASGDLSKKVHSKASEELSTEDVFSNDDSIALDEDFSKIPLGFSSISDTDEIDLGSSSGGAGVGSGNESQVKSNRKLGNFRKQLNLLQLYQGSHREDVAESKLFDTPPITGRKTIAGESAREFRDAMMRKSLEAENSLGCYPLPSEEIAVVHQILQVESEGSTEKLRNQSSRGRLGDPKYLINARWWRTWCDYVNFEDFKDQSCETLQLETSTYPRPGRILNSDLLKKGELLLRDDIMEHYDFEAVSFRIWKYLKELYRCDYEIKRYLVPDTNRPGELVLDLYPPEEFLKLGNFGLSTSLLKEVAAERANKTEPIESVVTTEADIEGGQLLDPQQLGQLRESLAKLDNVMKLNSESSVCTIQ
eukprot:CAMPEP_0115028432 /NCGR_PEP_ID=MMETSP0216-20121206/36286_1 /TAXON_ID=223996 /ORGANISM="Protocruzia adherens, Strain Boccale" /LENGTH=825 /DNA_ID=CAMNT_0002404593 /DNA_START=663 /DNA_END=3140 /DNA_ORIENTATION=+